MCVCVSVSLSVCEFVCLYVCGSHLAWIQEFGLHRLIEPT